MLQSILLDRGCRLYHPHCLEERRTLLCWSLHRSLCHLSHYPEFARLGIEQYRRKLQTKCHISPCYWLRDAERSGLL